MNLKATKKSVKPQTKVQSKPKAKPKLKNKSKPKVTKLKISEFKPSQLNTTQKVVITPSSTHRNNNLTPHNCFSQRVSLNTKKSKQQHIQHKLNLNCQIRMKELVTQEDIISLSDNDQEDSFYNECNVKQSCRSSFLGLSKDRAATLIQKMWRGFKTRKLMTNNLLTNPDRKKTRQILKQQFEKTHKLLHNRKKSNIEVIDMSQTKYLGVGELAQLLKSHSDFESVHQQSSEQRKTESIKKGILKHSQKKVDEEIEKLKREQAEKWNEIIKLINYIPSSDLNNNQLLKTLITKSQQNKYELQNSCQLFLPIDPGPIPSEYYNQSSSPSISYEEESPSGPMMIVNTNQHKFTEPLTERTEPSQFEDHPFMKIIELQSKMMKDRLNIEIKRLDKKYKNLKLTKQVYEQKKQQLQKDYEQQQKTVLYNKSQINFSLQKAHDALISSKRDASFLYRVTGRETSLRHSLSDESVFLKSFMKQQILVDEEFLSCTSQQSLKIKRTSTELESFELPQVIVEELEINYEDQDNTTEEIVEGEDKKKMEEIKETVQILQKKIEQYLINQLCVDIYVNNTLNSSFLPYYQLQTTFKFRKITDGDIESFLKTLLSPPFRPTKSDLLKRLNQKINPSARQLLKILRNQQPDEDDDSEFYELVIPETTFKEFREWKETSIIADLFMPVEIKNPIVMSEIREQIPTALVASREQQFKQRKKKVLKFQKDLQAMYYKAVFNCFNESIIEVKCSYSPFNGRSTISPGELTVSLLDANTPVSIKQVDNIVQKGKLKVLENLKYKCPSLDTSSYNSLNRFQDALMKQIQYEFNLGQHKWISFFDQYLEIATQLTNIITQALFTEVGKEIYKMQLCRI